MKNLEKCRCPKKIERMKRKKEIMIIKTRNKNKQTQKEEKGAIE